jgi:cytochrome oxidase Cu insertion factor (SCO1/SenC/PrrC family)
MTNGSPATPDLRGSRRWVMPLVVLLFAAPVLVAFLLAQLGWSPVGTRNNGTLLAPPQDFNAVRATTASGAAVAWNTAAGVWHVVMPVPPACGAPCATQLDALARFWTGLGRQAARVQVLVAGEADAALLAMQPRFPQALLVQLAPDELPHPTPAPANDPRIAAVPVYLVDPNGYLVMRYDAGSDLTGLRKDLARLLK